MSTIKVKCQDQVLVFENTPEIASGGIGEDYIQFDFCSLWTGYVRTAVFWRAEKVVYSQLLDVSDTCEIPPEVIADAGPIFFGVFGVNAEGRQRTSEVLTYNIKQGAITTDLHPSDPTPDIYNQLLQQYAQILATRLAAENMSVPADTAEALGLGDVTDPTVDDALNALLNMIGSDGGGSTGGGSADLTGAVRYDKAQTLTDEQKAQALANLGLDQPADDGGCIKYDTVQELAETQQARARSNIGAVSSEEVTAAIQNALNQQLGDYAVALAAMDEVIEGSADE